MSSDRDRENTGQTDDNEESSQVTKTESREGDTSGASDLGPAPGSTGDTLTGGEVY